MLLNLLYPFEFSNNLVHCLIPFPVQTRQSVRMNHSVMYPLLLPPISSEVFQNLPFCSVERVLQGHTLLAALAMRVWELCLTERHTSFNKLSSPLDNSVWQGASLKTDPSWPEPWAEKLPRQNSESYITGPDQGDQLHKKYIRSITRVWWFKGIGWNWTTLFQVERDYNHVNKQEQDRHYKRLVSSVTTRRADRSDSTRRQVKQEKITTHSSHITSARCASTRARRVHWKGHT